MPTKPFLEFTQNQQIGVCRAIAKESTRFDFEEIDFAKQLKPILEIENPIVTIERKEITLPDASFAKIRAACIKSGLIK